MKLFGGKPSGFTKKIRAILTSLKDFFANLSRKNKTIIAACLVAAAVAVTAAALVSGNVRSPVPTDTQNEPQAKPVVENEVIPDGDEIQVEGKAHKEDFFTILIVGTDKGGWNTDTIMLAAFDISAGKLNVLSIPRDTMVNVKRSNKKINAAFASGGRARNVEELKDEVESVTGIMPDKYAIVELDGFIDMIDAIGGVTVDVPIDMVYRDPAQDLTINIKKGVQTLDGYDSMGFMRYRRTYVEGDIGRIKVQQTFVKALVDKMLKPSTLTKIPQLARIIMDNVETDLSTGNIIWLGKEAIKLDPSTAIQTFVLPGEGGYYNRVSYYFLYENQVLEMVNEHFNPYVTAIKNVNIIDPRGDEVSAESADVPQEVPEEVPEEVPQEIPQQTAESEQESEQEPEPEETQTQEAPPEQTETQVADEPSEPEEPAEPQEEPAHPPEVTPPEAQETPAEPDVTQPEIPAEPAQEPEQVPEPVEPQGEEPQEPIVPEDFYQN